jgi:hypothetical protein
LDGDWAHQPLTNEPVFYDLSVCGKATEMPQRGWRKSLIGKGLGELAGSGSNEVFAFCAVL